MIVVNHIFNGIIPNMFRRTLNLYKYKSYQSFLKSSLRHLLTRSNNRSDALQRWSARSNGYSKAYSTAYTASAKRIDFLTDYFQQSTPTNVNWGELKQQYIERDREANDKNVDALIIKHLTTHCKWQEGNGFMQYIKDNDLKLNIGASGRVLRFYFYYGLQNELTTKEEMYIKQIYKDIVSKNAILDPITGECCIEALSLTKHWKECLKIIDMIKTIALPSRSAYTSLVTSAFVHNDPELGWKLLAEMAENLRYPYETAFLSWINYCVDNFKNDKKALLVNLEKLFIYLAANDLHLGISSANKLLNVASKHLKWKGDLVQIRTRGLCPCCKKCLGTINLSEVEHEELKSAFFNKVLVGKNIFVKSCPEERNQFLKMLDKNAPFDVVIDGLNVAYSIPNRVDLRILVSVVQTFVSEKKKILILGRKHMETWNRTDMQYLKNNSEMFLTNDLSYDDPFLLFAALHSPHTNFVSRDAMRGHRFLLGNERLRTIFKRWQQKNQMILTYVDQSGKTFIKKPLKYLPVAHKNAGWHIPYNIADNKTTPDSIGLPLYWICMQPSTK